MARTFRRQRTMQPIADLNVTNLIDLGFTLLIIFMIASTVIKQEQSLPVDLPVASKSQQTAPPDAKWETLTIRTNGVFLLGSRTVTLDELKRELTSFANQDTPPWIRIRTDRLAPSQFLVTVLDEITKHGLSKVSIDNKPAD